MWGRGEAIENVKLEIQKVVLASSINDMMFSLHFCSSIILALMLHYFFSLMTFYLFLFYSQGRKRAPFNTFVGVVSVGSGCLLLLGCLVSVFPYFFGNFSYRSFVRTAL
jgi:hypothetical protein